MSRLVQAPPEFLAMYVPGMEMAIKAAVSELNRMCNVTGQEPFYFGRGTALPSKRSVEQVVEQVEELMEGLPPHVPGQRRTWTDEQKRAVLEAFDAHPVSGRLAWLKSQHLTHGEIRRWRNEVGRRSNGHAKVNNATQEQILAWARQHEGAFSVEGFKAVHPDLHLRRLGNLVARGIVKKTAGKGQFKITAKGESKSL